jgi:hypothetical protein
VYTEESGLGGTFTAREDFQSLNNQYTRNGSDNDYNGSGNHSGGNFEKSGGDMRMHTSLADSVDAEEILYNRDSEQGIVMYGDIARRENDDLNARYRSK